VIMKITGFCHLSPRDMAKGCNTFEIWRIVSPNTSSLERSW